MSQTELYSLVGFIFLIVTGVTGAWWRVESKVKEVRDDASKQVSEAKQSAYHKSDEARQSAETALATAVLAREELARYQTHVAERYISKAGHRESNEQIMSALTNVKSAIDGTNQRIDRLFDERPKKQS